MTLLDQYIRREFLKIFFLGVIALSTIYLTVDFFELIDDFIAHRATLLNITRLFAFKVPLVLFRMIPVAILIASILTVTIMARNHELTALKACGVSHLRFSRSILFIGIVISLLTFAANEYILPYTTSRASFILRVDIKKKEPHATLRQSKIWLRARDHSLWNAQYLDLETQTMKGVTLYKVGSQFRLRERIDAKTAIWREGAWSFLEGSIQRFSEDGEVFMEPFAQMTIVAREKPEDFIRIKKKPDEMNLQEIQSYIRKLKRRGFNDTPAVVDMYTKTILPFASFIVILIGIPVSLGTWVKGGKMLGVSLGIFLGFTYFVFITIGISLGHSGRLPPLLAALGPHALFATAGLYLFLTNRQ